MSPPDPPSDAPSSSPHWSALFTESQIERFNQAVLTYFESQGIPITLENGVVTAERQGLGPFGLQNLAQLCAQAPEEKWQAIVNAHFDNLRRGQVEAAEISAQIADFDKIKSHLAVRIYPQDTFEETAREDMIFRQDLEGTLTVLVFDLPSTIRTVSRQLTSDWHRSDDELFQIGIENLRQNIEVDHERVMMSEDLYLNAYIGDGYYVAAYSLMLDQFTTGLGKYGALVGIPHRHIFLTFPINDIQVLQAINGFLMALPKLFEEGPGSITPNLYWYHQGKFLQLPYAYHEDEIRFSPPQAFLELIEILNPPTEIIH
jgi:hypothetical protein